MKKIFLGLSILIVTLSGCGLLPGSNGGAENNDKEYPATSGKFLFLDEEKNITNHYFIFDGSKDVMSFSYYENDIKKYEGTFRFVVPEEKGKDRTYCFSYCLDKKDGEKEDVLTCYSDDFSSQETFTQFTIMQEEKKYSNSDKLINFHTYRISELPYKMGTYVREGSSYLEEKDEYKYSDYYYIPSGTYALNDDVSFTSFYTKKRSAALFSYRNGDKVVEGVYSMGSDHKAMYFYIQHEIYQKVTREDKEKYDTTFSLYYPPDYNVHGELDVNSETLSFKISDFTPTSNAPTYAKDFWQIGTFTLVK